MRNNMNMIEQKDIALFDLSNASNALETAYANK